MSQLVSHEELKQMQRDIAEIKSAIIGNDYGNTGLVKRVDWLERWQRSLDRRAAYISGAVAASVILFRWVIEHL